MGHRLTPPAKRVSIARHLANVTTRQDTPAPAPPAWPSFAGSSAYVGTSASGRVVVFVDAALAEEGQQNARDLLTDADRVVGFNDQMFAATGGNVAVIVYALGDQTDGTGGADHDGCDYQSGGAIEVDASFGQSLRCSALFEAELSECAMNGQLCGLSTGEALSRWCASAASGNALSDFATAPSWYADGMANFVDQTDPSDRNATSIGCGMAFLSWLQGQGYSLAEIAQTMVTLGDAGTLAALYASLTGRDASTAWPQFSAAVTGLGGVSTDDPFAGGVPAPAPSPPAPAPAPAPSPAPSCGLSLEQGLQLVARQFGRALAKELAPAMVKEMRVMRVADLAARRAQGDLSE